MPLGEIARRLGFTSEPRTELSARPWTDERRMRDDYSGPKNSARNKVVRFVTRRVQSVALTLVPTAR